MTFIVKCFGCAMQFEGGTDDPHDPTKDATYIASIREYLCTPCYYWRYADRPSLNQALLESDRMSHGR